MYILIDRLENLLDDYDCHKDNRLEILQNIRRVSQDLMDKADELAQEIEKEIDYVSTDS